MTSGPKKISFGFSKLSRKTNIFKQPTEVKKVELIECVEGQAIKIKDAVEEVKGPLVIPLNESSNAIIDRIKQSRKAATNVTVKIEVDERPDSELTIDELAARELLREAQSVTVAKTATKVLTLPANKDEPILDGKSESTLEDYENIPIGDYGLAMLRGMGWKEGMAIGKNTKAVAPPVEPALRPKGMGLGANKMASAQKAAVDKNGKELVLKKGAFAKIIAGHHKGCFCEVEGLDDEAGRVVVKTALTKEVLSLNEFVLVPVTKDEFVRSSKVINNAKYEEFKLKSESSQSEVVKREPKIETNVSTDEDERHKSNGSKAREERDRSRSKERSRKHKKKSKKKHRSTSSDSSGERKESRNRESSLSKHHKHKSSSKHRKSKR